MIQINQSSQRDGFTFSLDPRSKHLLLQKEPNIHLLPRVFIAFDTANDLESYRGDLYNQVLQLLTQMTEEEVKSKFGGFEIVEPVSERKLYPAANA